MKRDKRFRGRDARPFVDPLFAQALSDDQQHRSTRQPKHDYKAHQLCRQVQRALSLALAGECGDDVLRDLYVIEVLPAPDASRLLVRVAMPPGLDVSLVDLLQRLDHAQPILRCAVAQAITRKRAPELTYIPSSTTEVSP